MSLGGVGSAVRMVVEGEWRVEGNEGSDEVEDRHGYLKRAR